MSLYLINQLINLLELVVLKQKFPITDKKDKGAVIDRFTNEAVVVAAPSKSKEVQNFNYPQ